MVARWGAWPRESVRRSVDARIAGENGREDFWRLRPAPYVARRAKKFDLIANF